ncbi:MAG: L,D-transpeptidase family protein [Rhizobiaceae bacterium]|nr:L,D-transpeptidase family protein [Rhizobiaceae bacterium]
MLDHRIQSRHSRRLFLLSSGSITLLTLAGCARPKSRRDTHALKLAGQAKRPTPYGAFPNEAFPIAAIPRGRLERKFQRQRVRYVTDEKPGTVIVDTGNFYLYHVERKGWAMRYGVGLGRAGFAWSGRARIAWKRKWPTWTPPEEMIARQPELVKWGVAYGGMPPGLDNPLGARALYIFQGNKDTLYRLHGTPEVSSIGRAVSSGCVRLTNHDIIDLYARVRSGSPIVVI